MRSQRSIVGELRPTQILFSFGVGSIVDLPNMSVMVMGLDDWDTSRMQPLHEERLLMAVRHQLGFQVERLYLPPIDQENEQLWRPALQNIDAIGIPVAPFPRWVRCPQCDLLAPLNFGVFEPKIDHHRPERARYLHVNCPKGTTPPLVLPVRFMVACEQGHLDDFPWLRYAHQGKVCANPVLRLREWGVSGSLSEIEVSCDTCKAKRRMRDAFMGTDDHPVLPSCRGRRPHLRDFQEKRCEEPLKMMLLGASNSWFPLTLSALHIPAATDTLAQLVEEYWVTLASVTSPEVLRAFRQTPLLQAFAQYSDSQIWEAVQAKTRAPQAEETEPPFQSLKLPEWQTFVTPDPSRNSPDFQLRVVAPPTGYAHLITKVVLAEKLREVRALIGFTRIDSPGDFEEVGEIPKDRRATLSRRPPIWVPASEVRGEGVFIQFAEHAVTAWCANVAERENDFLIAHKRWRQARNIEQPEEGFPGIRYVLLHSFAHALMRQIAIECGYTAASIRERIYAQSPENDQESMAGILFYTSAADSEGTLGGLVSLGEPEILGRHIDQIGRAHV